MNWAWSPPNSRSHRQQQALDNCSSSNRHSRRRRRAAIDNRAHPPATGPSVSRPHPRPLRSRRLHCHSRRTIIWDSPSIRWIRSIAATRIANRMSPTIGHATMARFWPAIRPSRCKYTPLPLPLPPFQSTKRKAWQKFAMQQNVPHKYLLQIAHSTCYILHRYIFILGFVPTWF